MDRRSLIAVAVCLVILLAYPLVLKTLGLEHYLGGRPPVTAPADSARRAAGALVVGSNPDAAPIPASPGAGSVPLAGNAAPRRSDPGSIVASDLPVGAAQLNAVPFSAPASALEQLTVIETPLYRATFSSRGARLMSMELKRYASANAAQGGAPRRAKGDQTVPVAERVQLAGGPSFGLDLGSDQSLRSLAGVTYATRESLDVAGNVCGITFVAQDSAGLYVRQTWRVRADDYSLDLEVELRGVPPTWRASTYSLTTQSWPLVNEHSHRDEQGSLRASSWIGTSLHHDPATSLLKGPKRFDGNVQWSGIQTRYFSGAVAVMRGSAQGVIAAGRTRAADDSTSLRLPSEARAQQPIAVSTLVVGLPSELSPVDHYIVYFGPNEYLRLSKLGHELDRLVDLGWSWIHPFSKALLRLLVWLHGLIGNYGVAIIALATLVRVLLHPLNMTSMRSMRSMQKIQPEVERLRKKYEGDPQAMNTAVMALYKENKVNPAGGCLPMVAQMPLFFALYAVLFNAIELRQAPFIGWIHDLSGPDVATTIMGFPLHLLPIIMAATGFLSQKMTPTDPKQAPTMYMMNAMMLFFFYNLPSGLVLYWTVMNLLTALQQWLVLREGDKPLVSPTVAKKAIST